MATPPVRTELADTYPLPSNATFRTGIGKLFDYVTGLLGSTGNAAEARTALGLVIGTDVVPKNGALGTPLSGDLANCTFPTLNQNTTGTAALATKAANGKQVGEPFMGLGNTAPAGSLAVPVAATAISRATYPLYHAVCAALGYPWGAGDGVTTFGMFYLAEGEALVQSNGNVRTLTNGVVMIHAHPITTSRLNAGGTDDRVLRGPQQASSDLVTSNNTSGGAKNLAAGVKALLCVQVE